MGKPIGLSVLKGSTIDDHLKTQEGRQFLAWIVSQEVRDDKFKDWSLRRNAYIREKMAEIKETGKASPHKTIVEEIAHTAQIKASSIDFEKTVIDKLDTIIDLLSQSGKAWDTGKEKEIPTEW